MGWRKALGRKGLRTVTGLERFSGEKMTPEIGERGRESLQSGKTI